MVWRTEREENRWKTGREQVQNFVVFYRFPLRLSPATYAGTQKCRAENCHAIGVVRWKTLQAQLVFPYKLSNHIL